MSFATATLTGTYELPNGVPARGTVEIIPNSKVIVDQAGNVTRTGRIKVALDADGHFSQTLIATDDATLEPATGRQYTVVVTLHDSRTAVPKLTGITLATGTTVDVADLISGVEASAVYSAFLTKVQYDALVARVGALEAGGGGGGAVSSVNTKTGAVVLSASDVGADASGAATSAQSAAIAAAAADATTKANAAQAAAVQRANHTGTQPASTVTGLAAVATSGAKADVGLGNVDNTSDVNKPVSTAQATANTAVQTAAATDATNKVATETTRATNAELPVAYTGTSRGAWAGSVTYAVGDVVTADGGLVRATTAHTSNPAGFTYDRANWEAIATPGLHGASTVRVRHLDLTNAGSTGTTVPEAGVFQRRPKRFSYKAERPLWTAQVAGDVTVTGGTVATGSRPLGSALVTCNTSGNTDITFPSRAAFDVTNGFFRVPLTMNLPESGRFIELHLSSDGSFTNYHAGTLLWSNNDSPPSGGKVSMFGIPTAEMTVVGTGANLGAITTARIRSQNVAAALTIDVEQIRWHPNTSDKAKVVLWFDDGGLGNQVAAMKVLAKYGFPPTIAAIANNLTGSGSTFNGDAARHAQNVYNAQIAVHAYGGNDHNITQATGRPILEQLLDYQHFEQAMGFTGGDDLAYWNPGLTQQYPLSDEVTIRKLFRSARTTAARFPETLPPIEPYRTLAYNGSTSTAMQAIVTRAVAYKGCAQFLWHALSAGNLTELTTFAAWLDTQRATVDVVTAAGAFDPLCT